MMKVNQTTTKSQNLRLPLSAKISRWGLQRKIRGSTRLTISLAHRLKSLQQVPLEVPGFGAFYVDLRLTNAHLLLAESPFDGLWRQLDEIAVLRQLVSAGEIAFDIGANIGLHSILLSRLVGPFGHVYAFEPNSELIPALSRTVAELGNVTLHPVALSNQRRTSALFVPPDDSVASLSDWTVNSHLYAADGPAHVVSCVEQTLDSLVETGLIPQPNFIKCDVEGGELWVFEGARKILDRIDAPIVLFEVNECASRGFNLAAPAAKDFLERLEQPHYSFLNVGSEGKLTRIDELQFPFCNVLAVPRSRIPHYPDLLQ